MPGAGRSGRRCCGAPAARGAAGQGRVQQRHSPPPLRAQRPSMPARIIDSGGKAQAHPPHSGHAEFSRRRTAGRAGAAGRGAAARCAQRRAAPSAFAAQGHPAGAPLHEARLGCSRRESRRSNACRGAGFGAPSGPPPTSTLWASNLESPIADRMSGPGRVPRAAHRDGGADQVF